MSKLRTRLALLLREMRTWEPGTKPKATAQELAARFGLDVENVLILARSEGFQLAEEGTPIWVDPDADTEPIEVRR